MAVTVLDASAVIAFRDPIDALHARAVDSFRAHASNDLVLPASVYAEVLVGPMRHGAPALASLEEFVQDFAMHIAPLSPDIARHAALLRAQTPSLRLPDAFVLATGDLLEATSVLTGDRSWAKLSPRVQLV
jgi:PIN domain nuclease of toxin-antitoxin system